MIKKTIYVLKTNSLNQDISNGINVENILESIKDRQKYLKYISYDEFFEKEWSSNEYLFVIHSFKDWPDISWQSLLEKVKTKIIVAVTEFMPNPDLLEKTFNNNKIQKIIVCAENVFKFLQKKTTIENSKIKYIPLCGDGFLFEENKVNPMISKDYFPTILVPSILSEHKNYSEILEAIDRLRYKFPKLFVIMLLKDKGKNQHILEKIKKILKSKVLRNI